MLCSGRGHGQRARNELSRGRDIVLTTRETQAVPGVSEIQLGTACEGGKADHWTGESLMRERVAARSRSGPSLRWLFGGPSQRDYWTGTSRGFVRSDCGSLTSSRRTGRTLMGRLGSG